VEEPDIVSETRLSGRSSSSSVGRKVGDEVVNSADAGGTVGVDSLPHGNILDSRCCAAKMDIAVVKRYEHLYGKADHSLRMSFALPYAGERILGGGWFYLFRR
jgi:hypothetical protein